MVETPKRDGIGEHTPVVGFFNAHPDPIFKISPDHKILAANPAAVVATPEHSPVGRTCYNVIYGLDTPCPTCCLADDASKRWRTQASLGVKLALRGADDDYFVTTSLFGTEDGKTGCFECVHPLPPAMRVARDGRNVAADIASADSIAQVLVIIRNYLSGSAAKPRYRVRQYHPDLPKTPTTLTCTWHDEFPGIDPQYVDGLRGMVLCREGETTAASFYAEDHQCIALVSPAGRDSDFFKQHFHAIPVGERTWQADPNIFRGLHLYELWPDDRCRQVFRGVQFHTWLDIPLGPPGQLVATLSITPQPPRGRLAREEVELLALLQTVANLHIEGLHLRDTDRRRLLLEEIHEARQPAFMALGSIELLRDRDRSRAARSGSRFDRVDYYLKKNIETAVRLVYFLNDAPNVSRETPCGVSPMPVNMLRDVLAPIFNLFRHTELLHALNRKALSSAAINEKNLTDIALSADERDEQCMAFNVGSQYDMHYDAKLGTLDLFVDTYRLQELMFNLLTNSSKYRASQTSFTFRIRRVWEPELPDECRSLCAPFYLIDVEDHGLGFEEGEALTIFGLCVRGSAADKTLGMRGMGRGLFIVREILLSMGGDIYVDSLRAPTRLRLFIPAICATDKWGRSLPETQQQMAALRSYLGDRIAPL